MDSNNRPALKQAVFVQILFGRYFTASPLWRGLERLFPRLARIIGERKAQDYRQLAIELQRHEATAMIGNVVPRFTAQFGDMPFLTVHDSVVVPYSKANAAREILERTIHEISGNVPALRTTLPPEHLTNVTNGKH